MTTNIYKPTFHWGITPILRDNILSTSIRGASIDFWIIFNGGIPSHPYPTFISLGATVHWLATGTYSLWGKKSTRGQPPATRKQPTWGQTIPSTTGPLFGHPYPRITNIVWNQHHQSINPTILQFPLNQEEGHPMVVDHPMVEAYHPMEEDTP
jgi:hypothetical protein